MTFARAGQVPTLSHEAPLAVLREDLSLVPFLLTEALGVEVPPHVRIELADADFTQAVPTELRADLVVVLRAGPPDHEPVMGVVIEMQLARDARKRATWPLYLASLHARLGCATCLVVMTTDDAIARWAAQPITTLQPGVRFVPVVLGPAQVPRLTDEQALAHPWLAVLSAIVHCREPDRRVLLDRARAALQQLPWSDGVAGCKIILQALALDVASGAELTMHPDNAKFFASLMTDVERAKEKRDLARGLAQGRLEATRTILGQFAVQRLGGLSEDQRRRIEACESVERLNETLLRLGTTLDPVAAAQLLAEL